MTHPLTPREKVVAILDEHTTVGGTSAYRTGQVNSDELTGLILTALASVSGDQAELAENLSSPLNACCHRDECKALLAENAALRADRDRIAEELHGEINYAAEQSVRATEAERALSEHRITADLLVSSLKSDLAEAERKLAGAVGLVERSIDLMTDEYADTKAYREEARALISKEAERG